jgi:hypothetical protein
VHGRFGYAPWACVTRESKVGSNAVECDSSTDPGGVIDDYPRHQSSIDVINGATSLLPHAATNLNCFGLPSRTDWRAPFRSLIPRTTQEAIDWFALALPGWIRFESREPEILASSGVSALGSRTRSAKRRWLKKSQIEGHNSRFLGLHPIPDPSRQIPHTKRAPHERFLHQIAGLGFACPGQAVTGQASPGASSRTAARSAPWSAWSPSPIKAEKRLGRRA